MNDERRSSTMQGSGQGGDGREANAAPSSNTSFDRLEIPRVELPRGGGAIRGIDEQFQVNTTNGTGQLTVPLPLATGRGGFAPSISLSYNSGSGNGVFGLGWSLTTASIQRRTDKRLPTYDDGNERDVFLLSGAEDLVPTLVDDGAGNWNVDEFTAPTGERVKRYRPRTEGMFARIERITRPNEATSYWKVTTPSNLVTIYGRSSAARIADPASPERAFRWLPELSYDDKGQCLEYEYVAEDLVNVMNSVSEAHRLSGLATIANTYLKRIRYTNKNAYYPDPSKPYDPPAPTAPTYFFEVVFDYGDHDELAPTPAATQPWPCRLDPFSQHKSGFEIRTYRLCQRVLLFHHFKELGNGVTASPSLVRSLDLTYRYHANPAATATELRNIEVDYPIAFTPTAYRRSAIGYERESQPRVELSYQEAQWDTTVRDVEREALVHVPVGVSRGYQWVDLWGEGIAGILAEQGTGWFYKSNLGRGELSAARPVIPKPSFVGLADGTLSVQELESDGRKFVVSNAAPVRGSFELSQRDGWQPFRAFDQVPNIDMRDPRARFIDLDGDGRADLLVAEDHVFTWYASEGTDGYAAPARSRKVLDEDHGPALVFSDATDTIFLADMSGDGLTDIVRIRNGEVCYWPNLGFGAFGPKVTMAFSPLLDRPEAFDPKLVHLADINGTGVADLVYAGDGRLRVWLNQSGNAYSEPISIDPFPTTEHPNQLAIVDLLGTGTACIVWSSPMPRFAGQPLRYIDLLGGRKPYVVSGYQNNLGKVVRWEYRSSTQYYLDDKRAGRPWATKLPFPVQCVSKVSMTDEVSRTYLSSEYRYHHGAYDHVERELRGFGMVEQIDSETFDHFVKSGASNVVDEPLHQPPVLTRTWFDTGAFFDDADLRAHYRGEFFHNTAFTEHDLADPAPPATWTPEERRQAARARRGTMIRQETYALDDNPGVSEVPYSVIETIGLVQRTQPIGGNPHAVFLVTSIESISYAYERVAADPRITHTFNTVIDELGNVRESASIAYPRQLVVAGLPSIVATAQQRLHVTYARTDYTNDVITPAAYRLRTTCERESFELTGVAPTGTFFTRDELRTAFSTATSIAYEATPSGAAEKRIVDHSRKLFLANDTVNLLPLRQLESLGLSGEAYTLAFTAGLLTARYGGRATTARLQEGAYTRSNTHKASGLFPAIDNDDEWWVPSGRALYPPTPQSTFYMADRYRDPFGSTTSVTYYDNYQLLIEQVTDGIGNATTVELFDFRLLAPVRVRDCNDNLTEVRHDLLGHVVGTAVLGKGTQADDFAGFVADLTPVQRSSFFADPVAHGPALLQHATSRFVYDLTSRPARAATITRETHHQAAVVAGSPSRLHYSFAYCNGSGQIVMTKVQAKPGLAKQLDASNQVIEVDTSPALRWIGTGRTVLNNKGNPIKKYEPYFSVTHDYEDAPALVEIGVSPIMSYDPLGRLVRTDAPNDTFSKVETMPWRIVEHDPNDTVCDSNWYAERTTGSLASDVRENDAARKAEVHHGTPAISHLDSLGRPFYAVAHNRFVDPTTLTTVEERHESHSMLDIESHQLASIDPRGNLVGSREYSLHGVVVHRTSLEAGEHWTLPDCAGRAMYDWTVKDGQEHVFRTRYDVLRRPTSMELVIGSGSPIVLDRSTYGEGQISDRLLNLRGRAYAHFDQAGHTTNVEYDFKGNLLVSTLQLTRDVDRDVDWSSPPALDTEIFRTETMYDAMSRPVRVLAPHSNLALADITLPTYNESGGLEVMMAHVRGAAAPTSFVLSIDYDEKAQRTRITYANGTSTIYKYDPLTFRLVAVVTARGVDPEIFWDDPSLLASPSYVRRCLQFLRYTWDPAGNITHVRDDAQQTIYFNNSVIEPSCDYTYDATYRLIQAVGREHIGQNKPVDESDGYRSGHPHPNDPLQMRRYTQRYDYDAAGNMRAMRTVGSWSRVFTYATASNQLLTAQPSGAMGSPYTYIHDEHGSMRGMQHLSGLEWSFKDELRHVVISATSNQHAWYVYSAGQRIRKVMRKGAIREERLYLGNRERYRRYNGTTLELERETLHIADDKRRIAMVDTPTIVPAGSSESRCIRYQYANHLGTACLEVDGGGQIISYEEYYPFGSTSYQATDQTREVAAKRYRYTGKERDEETGLYYHGARYYAPWLARWTAVDPIGTEGGLNVYEYCSNNPVSLRDPHGTNGEVCGVWDDEALVCRPEPCVPASLSPEVATGPPSSSAAPRMRIRRHPAPAAPAPPPAPPSGHTVEPLPPVSPTDTSLYVPPGFAWTQYQAAVREADNPDNPLWARAGMFVLGTLASPVAYAEEYLARPLANVPFTMHNAGIKIGEHSARAYLLSQQGETGEATVEVLQGIVAFTQGFNAGLSAGIPVAGAIESRVGTRALAATEEAVAAETSTAAPRPAPAGTGTPPPAAAAPRPAPAPAPAPRPAPTPAPAVTTTWQAHEAAVTTRLRTANPGVAVGEQVTLDVTNTTTGQAVRIRIDNIYPNGSGAYQLVDAKFSAVNDLTTRNLSSTLTPNQSLAYGWIRSGQPISVVPAGANATAAGLQVGAPITIAPTVQVHVNSASGIVVRIF
jgi:RHS repeat-associated protein